MALKVLILRSRLEKAKKDLEGLREKDAGFAAREAELEAAITEMTEQTTKEERELVEGQVEGFQEEKEAHDKEKGILEADEAANHNHH